MSKRKQTILIATLLFCLSLIHNGTLLADQQVVKFISSPFGTAGYVIGTALEDISRKQNAAVRISTLESQGGVYTIQKINSLSAGDRLDTMVLASYVSPVLAREGVGLFKKPLPAKLKALGFSWSVSVFFATSDPDIKTMEDLAGKTVVVGLRTQDNWGFCPSSWLEIGANLKGKVNIQYTGLNAANDAFLDGKADAIVVGGYVNPVTGQFIPSPKFQELLAANREMHYIGIDEEAIKKTSSVMGNFPSISYKLSSGSFSGQKADLSTGFTSVAWWVDETFPEDTAYQVTKLIIDNADKFQNYHAIGAMITPQSMVWVFNNVKNVEVHPGSKKAFVEAGLM